MEPIQMFKDNELGRCLLDDDAQRVLSKTISDSHFSCRLNILLIGGWGSSFSVVDRWW